MGSKRLIPVFSYLAVFILGEVGNLYVIIVLGGVICSLQQARLKPSSRANIHVYFYILCLSIADSLSLAVLPMLVVKMYYNDWCFGIIGCRAYLSIEHLSKFVSTAILTLLSFDRMIAICATARFKGVRSLRFSVSALAVSITLGSLFAGFISYNASVVTIDYGINGQGLNASFLQEAEVLDDTSSWSLVESTDFVNGHGANGTSQDIPFFLAQTGSGSDKDDGDVHVTATLVSSVAARNIRMCYLELPPNIEQTFVMVLFVMGYCIPAILILAFNTSLLRGLWLQAHEFAGSTIPLSSITISVILVTSCYFACWTPYWLVTVVVNHFWPKVAETGAYAVVALAVHILPYINCCCNPIWYTWMNKQLRQQWSSINSRSNSNATMSRITSSLSGALNHRIRRSQSTVLQQSKSFGSRLSSLPISRPSDLHQTDQQSMLSRTSVVQLMVKTSRNSTITVISLQTVDEMNTTLPSVNTKGNENILDCIA